MEVACRVKPGFVAEVQGAGNWASESGETAKKGGFTCGRWAEENRYAGPLFKERVLCKKRKAAGQSGGKMSQKTGFHRGCSRTNSWLTATARKARTAEIAARAQACPFSPS